MKLRVYYDDADISDASPVIHGVIAPLKLSKQASRAFLIGLEVVNSKSLNDKLEQLK